MPNVFRRAANATGRGIKTGFNKTVGFVKGANKTVKWAVRGAVVGAMLGNVAGGYKADYVNTQANLRKGAESVLVDQARAKANAEAMKNAGRFDRALMGTGLKAKLTSQQLAQIQAQARADARRYGSMNRTVKNMPLTPKVELNKKGAANAAKGAGAGAAVLGGAALAYSLRKKRIQPPQPRTP